MLRTDTRAEAPRLLYAMPSSVVEFCPPFEFSHLHAFPLAGPHPFCSPPTQAKRAFGPATLADSPWLGHDPCPIAPLDFSLDHPHFCLDTPNPSALCLGISFSHLPKVGPAHSLSALADRPPFRLEHCRRQIWIRPILRACSTRATRKAKPQPQHQQQNITSFRHTSYCPPAPDAIEDLTRNPISHTCFSTAPSLSSDTTS